MLPSFRFRNVAIGTLALLITIGVIVAKDRARLFAPPTTTPAADADPEMMDDPIAPGRPFRVLGPRGAFGAIRGAEDGGEWVTARPEQRFQPSKAPDARAGVDPCDAPDPGFEGFSHWKPLGGGALYLEPERGAFDENGRFDLILHFHGQDLARKGFVAAQAPFVFVGLSLEGGYRERLAGPEAFDHLLLAIESALSEGRKSSAKARHVALTSWSGGYEAVGTLLEHAAQRVDAVVLLDGLHVSRTPETMQLQLAPFVAYAKRAAQGEVFMLVTHSSIRTDTFASTTETAHQLIHALGGSPLEVARSDALGLELASAFSLGDFHVRGYAGGGKPDHCAQLALLQDAAIALARRWQLRER